MVRLENEGDEGSSAKQENLLDLGPQGPIITADEVQNIIQNLIYSITDETGIKPCFLSSTVSGIIRFRVSIA